MDKQMWYIHTLSNKKEWTVDVHHKEESENELAE